MSTKKNPPGMLDALARATGLKPPPRPGPDPSRASEDGANSYTQPGSRRGREGWLTYHDPAVLQQIRMISAERKITQQKLAAEALNMLFAKYGKAQIA